MNRKKHITSNDNDLNSAADTSRYQQGVNPALREGEEGGGREFSCPGYLGCWILRRTHADDSVHWAGGCAFAEKDEK